MSSPHADTRLKEIPRREKLLIAVQPFSGAVAVRCGWLVRETRRLAVKKIVDCGEQADFEEDIQVNRWDNGG